MNDYEQKQQHRKERLEAGAQRARAEALRRFETASSMLDAIPLGQPILVGHYSEGRDRRYRDRAVAQMDKAFEASRRAQGLAARAASVGNGGISSDDPDAIAKLEQELERLEERQRLMVETNRLVRKGDRGGLVLMGYSARLVEELFRPDMLGQVGFADYELKNNGANARRIQKRIAELKSMATEPTRSPIDGDGFRIVEDRGINRCCVEFDSKPAPEVRAELRRSGFRWSPTRNAWVRQLNNGAWQAAQYATRQLRRE